VTVVVANQSDYRVTVDGKDITGFLRTGTKDSAGRPRPRLVSLSINDKPEEADQLDLVIDDTDGRVDIPSLGVTVHVWIGWKAGPDVQVGLIDKGSFTVDEVSHSGPPDIITIRARSADFTAASSLRTRKSKAWHGKTLGDVVRDVAHRQKLTPHISADLDAIHVDAVHQSRESDAAFLRRLGREHDAVAKIKAGKLVFSRKGTGTTASGKKMPALVINRRDGDKHSYEVKKREEVTGVTASYHDRGEAKHERAVVGEKKHAKHLSRVYATKEAAERAAKAAMARSKRFPATFNHTMALGRGDVYPEQHATVRGFKPKIDAQKWLVGEVTHTVTDQGFSTAVKYEPA
jgi:phage protein D